MGAKLMVWLRATPVPVSGMFCVAGLPLSELSVSVAVLLMGPLAVAGGAAVSGADVTVTFYMAAMRREADAQVAACPRRQREAAGAIGWSSRACFLREVSADG
jgi:hypothetical protein